MRYMILRRILIITCEMCCRTHLSSIRNTYILSSSSCRVDGHGDALWLLWQSLFPCTRPNLFSGNIGCPGTWRLGNNFGPLWIGYQPWIPYSEPDSGSSWWCIPCLLNWCFLHCMMRFWTAFHDILDYDTPTGIFQHSVIWTTNLISL